jgi:Polyketide cyclase / dehydrase and lipid transport
MEWTGARYADRPTVQVSTSIAAAPERIWPYVAGIEWMPRFSEELQAVAWLDGADGPVVGARFRGSSAHASLGEWSTTSFVIEYEPERVFAWAVEDPQEPTAVWRFTLEGASDGASELTQWMQLGPGRSGLSIAIDRMPDKEEKIVFVRLREFEASMQHTLETIKNLAERPA